jgi:hypothetical protein
MITGNIQIKYTAREQHKNKYSWQTCKIKLPNKIYLEVNVMTKCCTCSKEIKNIYRLDNKNYGYNCYKLALALKMAKLQDIKNNEYALKCFATIEVFKNKEFSREWNNNFKKSILDQWENCKKLTGGQLNCIIKKMDNKELFEIKLIYALVSTDDKYELCNDIFYDCKQRIDTLINYKNDSRLHEVLKYTIEKMNKSRVRRNKELKAYYIINYEECEELRVEGMEKNFYELCSNKKLEKYKNDEDVKILEIIEI